MKVRHARILVVVAAALGALLSAGPALADGTALTISGLSAEAGPSGPVIHLYGADTSETVHYSPQPGVWYVEMPEATWDPSVAFLSEPELGIDRAELAAVEAFGKRMTRLTVWLSQPAQLELVQQSGGLELRFDGSGDAPESAGADSAAAPSASGPIPATAAAKPQVPVPVPAAEASVTPAAEASATPAAEGNAAPIRSASSLLGIVPVSAGNGVVVRLEGDGSLAANAFSLPSPDRVVIDLPGVVNRVSRHIQQVGSDLVRRVRVAQFRAAPDPVTRVVIDLEHPVDFRVVPSAEGATVEVGSPGFVPAVETQEPARAAAAPASRAPAVKVTRESEAGPDAEPPAAPASLPAPVRVASADAMPDAETTAPSPWVAEPSQMLEQAAAAQTLGTSQAETYKSQEVESEERQFTGEPISLQLKDADIKDVLRTFAALTNLNIVVDPGVSGSVTVELHNVPWDQALDLILKINNLDYVLENNVLRVAPLAKLAQEKQQAAQFAKQQEAAKPVKTVVKPLSYAKATYVASLVTRDAFLLSDRGSVVVDERTNTLIIRDTVDRVEGVLRLVETLDQPTPQVVIEGRIVETTRTFSHQLGVNWGFEGLMDAEHGNDTGLNFPNSIDVSGRVGLEKGTNGIISFAFADILNTFNLDFTLSAAESDGLAKIVSSPRVTTQNLMRANIRSGLQIPVQTVANNTVTVQYVDATLNLDVTPQITAEGTVMLDIDIKKQQPQTALNVTGGNNVPIFTRAAKTQLLVRDGGTTVIAGIYQVNDQVSNNSVPGLAKIPLLGALFRNKDVSKSHDELLIFITPRIVKY